MSIPTPKHAIRKYSKRARSDLAVCYAAIYRDDLDAALDAAADALLSMVYLGEALQAARSKGDVTEPRTQHEGP